MTSWGKCRISRLQRTLPRHLCWLIIQTTAHDNCLNEQRASEQQKVAWCYQGYWTVVPKHQYPLLCSFYGVLSLLIPASVRVHEGHHRDGIAPVFTIFITILHVWLLSRPAVIMTLYLIVTENTDPRLA